MPEKGKLTHEFLGQYSLLFVSNYQIKLDFEFFNRLAKYLLKAYDFFLDGSHEPFQLFVFKDLFASNFLMTLELTLQLASLIKRELI